MVVTDKKSFAKWLVRRVREDGPYVVWIANGILNGDVAVGKRAAAALRRHESVVGVYNGRILASQIIEDVEFVLSSMSEMVDLKTDSKDKVSL